MRKKLIYEYNVEYLRQRTWPVKQTVKNETKTEVNRSGSKHEKKKGTCRGGKSNDDSLCSRTSKKSYKEATK